MEARKYTIPTAFYFLCRTYDMLPIDIRARRLCLFLEQNWILVNLYGIVGISFFWLRIVERGVYCIYAGPLFCHI